MKLFHRLLVAPAALSLLAPLSANASEINVSGITSYVDSEQEEEFFDHKSFDNSLATSNINEVTERTLFEAGSFSDTTVASQTAAMMLSAGDGDDSIGDEQSVQMNYYYGMSLDTSFTGEDNLNVGIETGNSRVAPNTAFVTDFGSQTADKLTVVDVNYTRSFGDLTVQFGDSLDASSQFTGACAYSGFTDHLSDCGTGRTAGAGGDITVSSVYDFGNGLTAGFGTSALEGSTSSGVFTKEGVDLWAAQVAYTADTYGLALSYSDTEGEATGLVSGLTEDTTTFGLSGYYIFGGPVESISVGYEASDQETSKDSTNWFVGLETAEVGPGSFSAGLGTSAHITDGDTETLAYEASYSWDVNDSTAMTVGGFMVERADSAYDDATGMALTTTFSF